jgi:hypothetical protein
MGNFRTNTGCWKWNLELCATTIQTGTSACSSVRTSEDVPQSCRLIATVCLREREIKPSQYVQILVTLLNDGRSVRNRAHILEQALHESPAPSKEYRDRRSRAIEEQQLQYQGEHGTVGRRCLSDPAHGRFPYETTESRVRDMYSHACGFIATMRRLCLMPTRFNPQPRTPFLHARESSTSKS